MTDRPPSGGSVAYFIDSSIHEIPSVAYIARELGGTVYTTSELTAGRIREEHPDLRVRRLPTIDEIRRDITASGVMVILYPDYHLRYFRDLPGVKHVQLFHGTSDKVYDYRREVLDYDLFLIPGVEAYERYRRKGLLKKGTGALVGYPKLDRVFGGELKREEELKKLVLNPECKTVLYAPTWVDKAFNSSWKKFRGAFAEKPDEDINLIIKLHPNIKRYRKAEVEAFKELLRGRKNTRLFEEASDIVPLMAASDLIAGDVSAVMREYLAFQRPMVFLSCKPKWLWRREKKKLWDCGKVVTDPAEVWPVIRGVLETPQRYAPAVRRHRELTFYKMDGRAAMRAAAEIRAILPSSTESGLNPLIHTPPCR
jgi:hypothetical protein